ncbi:MAG TPA: hypothetical protein VGO49_03960 [Bradyrhizobium sp.]|jgi:hypothetical protein|nr:hypothetical protein [Bradyrhizobium sp.]
MDLDHIDKAIVENYRKLRTRIGIIALAFPVVLIAVGSYWGFGIQPTLSDYYYATEPVGQRIDAFPVRLWFCGILFVVGIFLYKYQGFSENENRWLSLAGLFALGVAVFPMSRDGKGDYDWVLAWTGLPQLSLHGIFAVLTFGCIAVVIFWYADSTLSELKTAKPAAYRIFKSAYVGIAAFLAVSIGITVFLHIFQPGKGHYILALECLGIWAFAAYWFVKNWELTEVAEVLKRRKTPMPHRTVAELADKL